MATKLVIQEIGAQSILCSNGTTESLTRHSSFMRRLANNIQGMAEHRQANRAVNGEESILNNTVLIS